MSRDLINAIIDDHRKLLEVLQTDGPQTIIAVSDAIIKSIEAGGCIYICGNGGSAADAQHIAGELVGRFKTERRALPAVALSTDTSILTSLGNDYSYDIVFARQVEALVKEGDILWAFSTSGTSKNVIKAVELARSRGAVIIGFTGKPQTPLEQMSDVCLCAGHESTARSQEIHQIAYHIICELVEKHFTPGKA